jgi:hypothetical protein
MSIKMNVDKKMYRTVLQSTYGRPGLCILGLSLLILELSVFRGRRDVFEAFHSISERLLLHFVLVHR